MLYKRTGIPEVDEIVLCKVTTIFPNSVFVEMLEYHRQGMVHISEIAPGRIRNLRDYVSEGREIICKVLRIDKEKGHIDLSLRRVNSHQRQEKLDEIKQELKSESLVKNLAKKLNKPYEELYNEITTKTFSEYSHLYLLFQDIISESVKLDKLGFDQNLIQELTTAVIDKFKPPKIFLYGDIKLETYHSDGLEKIKNTLIKIEAVSPTIRLTYLGGGRYKITIEDLDYKLAEKTFSKVEEIITAFIDKSSTASLIREKQD